ncbi:MAG: OmpA family protein [bacterium]
MQKRRLFVLFVGAFLSVLIASRASALTKGFEASSFHPATDGGPYFTIYGSEGLAQWQWVIGTTANYAYRPFQLIQNGVRVRGIIDDALIQDVHGAVGVVGRWLEFGVDVPVAWWLKFTDPNVAAATAQNKMTMGDVQINFKSELVKVLDHRVGLAILPFITLPSGSGKYYNGAGGVTGGGKLILEFMPVDRWRIALNAGALARPKFTVLNIEQSNQLLYGLGTAVNATKQFSIAAEVWGRARLSGLFQNKQESPVEADLGFKYALADCGVTLDVGGGAGIVRGSGAPTFRTFLGVAYKSPTHEKKEEAAAPVKDPLDDVRGAVVHFSFNNKDFATLDDAQVAIRVVDALKQVPDAKITITGYTDSIGSKGYNTRLSLKRAERMKAYLVSSGIAADKIAVKGHDGANPVGDNKTKEGRAKNRRVEFKVNP